MVELENKEKERRKQRHREKKKREKKVGSKVEYVGLGGREKMLKVVPRDARG